MGLAVVSSGQVDARIDADCLIIEVSGRFDQSVHAIFLRALNQLTANVCQVEVDLYHCHGLDSTGLGMLLILRDRSGLTKDHLILKNAPDDIKRILSFANFQELFSIQ